MSWIECPGGAYNLKASANKVSKAQLEFDIQCVRRDHHIARI